jgi:hypothetical protein
VGLDGRTTTQRPVLFRRSSATPTASTSQPNNLSDPRPSHRSTKPTYIPGLTDEPAWPTLRGHLLALAAETGQHPLRHMLTAASGRDLGTAGDMAAVLYWRLTPLAPIDPGPLPWLLGIPPTLRRPHRRNRRVARRQRHRSPRPATNRRTRPTGDSFRPMETAPRPACRPFRRATRGLTNGRQHTPHLVAGTTTASVGIKHLVSARTGQPHPANKQRRAAAQGLWSPDAVMARGYSSRLPNTSGASAGAKHPDQRVWSLADMPQVCRYTAHARASHLRECSTARPTQKKGVK